MSWPGWRHTDSVSQVGPRALARAARAPGLWSSRKEQTPWPCQNPSHTRHPHSDLAPRFPVVLGVALNVVAAARGDPYHWLCVLEFRYKRCRMWILLGRLEHFPERQTRLATYKRIPSRRPGTVQRPTSPAGCGGLRVRKFQVFAINCTHLGCPVRWFQESGLFMCPCHGGVYYADGSRASGPPPRGLFTYEYKVQNGQLLVLGGQLPTLSTQSEA